jgi:hypothetical protein
LKAIFDDLGRKGEWTESGLLKFGNPVSSGAVMHYSEALKLEQAKAHIHNSPLDSDNFFTS